MKSISASLRAGLLGIVALSATGTAQAIEVSYEVLVTIGDLRLDAGPMTVTYDEDDVPTSGSDAIFYGIDNEFFNLELDIMGVMFDETDDLRFGFGGFPQLFFSDGTLSSFNYMIEADFNGAPIKLRGGQIVGDQALFSSVPVPGTALLSLLGLGLLASRHRQRGYRQLN